MSATNKLVPILVASLLIACGGDDDAKPAAPAAAQPPSVAPAPTAPAQTTPPPPTTPPGDPTQPGPTTPGAPGGCDAKNLCLDVASIRQGKTPLAGRLALIWMPPQGGGGAVEVAYDVAFAGTETRVTIPLANAKVPTDAAVSCTRSCPIATACPCTGEFKMAYGMVVVVTDTDGDGKASVDDEVLGISDATVLYSATALKPPPEGFTWSGKPMSQAFPSGVEQGTTAYTAAGETFTPAAAGAASKLQVCDTLEQDQCSVGN